MLDSIASRFITNTTQDNGGAEQWKDAVRRLQALNKDKNEAQSWRLKNEKVIEDEKQKTKDRLEEDLQVDRNVDSFDMSIAKSAATPEAEEMLRKIAIELNRIMPAIETVKEESKTTITLDTTAVPNNITKIFCYPLWFLNES